MLMLELKSAVILDSVMVVAMLPLRPVVLEALSSEQQHWVIL